MCFKKLKSLFSDPSKFFKEVGKEKDYWTALKFFVVIYVASTLIQILISLPINIRNLGLAGNQILPFVLTYLIIGVVAALVMPFIGSFFIHLGILITGGRKGFFNTFKAMTYGTLVIVGYSLVSSIIVSALILLSLDEMLGSNIIIGIISLIGLIHMFFVQTVGVSMLHSISKAKAFLGIILIPLIIIIVLIAIGGTALIGLV